MSKSDNFGSGNSAKIAAPLISSANVSWVLYVAPKSFFASCRTLTNYQPHFDKLWTRNPASDSGRKFWSGLWWWWWSAPKLISKWRGQFFKTSRLSLDRSLELNWRKLLFSPTLSESFGKTFKFQYHNNISWYFLFDSI